MKIMILLLNFAFFNKIGFAQEVMKIGKGLPFCSYEALNLGDLTKKYGPSTSKDFNLNALKFTLILNKLYFVCDNKKIAEVSSEKSVKHLIDLGNKRHIKELKSLIAEEKGKLKKLSRRFKKSSRPWLNSYADFLTKLTGLVAMSELDT